MDYEELLKKAKKELPETGREIERLEIPRVRGHLQGSKTVLSNLQEIAGVIDRPLPHLLKYLLKETASAGEAKGQAVILNSKVPASKINDKIVQYVDEFVICPNCGKPDTKMTKEGIIYFLKCQACGSRKAVKSKF